MIFREKNTNTHQFESDAVYFLDMHRNGDESGLSLTIEDLHVEFVYISPDRHFIFVRGL